MHYFHEAIEKYALQVEASRIILDNTTSVYDDAIAALTGTTPQAFVFMGDTNFVIACMQAVRDVFPSRVDKFTFLIVSNATIANVLERMTYFTFPPNLIANTFTTRPVPSFQENLNGTLAFGYQNDTMNLYGPGTELSYAGFEGYMIGRYIATISELAGLGTTSPPRDYYERAYYNAKLSLGGFWIGNAPLDCNQPARTVRKQFQSNVQIRREKAQNLSHTISYL